MNETGEPEAMHEALALVLFSVGAWRIGIEARQVRASHAAPAGAPVGELAATLGFPPVFASSLGRQCLTLKRTKQDKEILVDAPVDLASLPIDAIHALPPLLAARTGLRGLRALAIWPDAGEKTFTLLFDADFL